MNIISFTPVTKYPLSVPLALWLCDLIDMETGAVFSFPMPINNESPYGWYTNDYLPMWNKKNAKPILSTATKIRHSFFPTGKGLAIEWESDVTFLYTMPDGSFTAWSCGGEVEFKAPIPRFKSIEIFLDKVETMPELSTVGVSQTAMLTDLLDDMPDRILGAIYKEVVGYDVFIDSPDTPADNRELVVEVLNSPGIFNEVFGIN